MATWWRDGYVSGFDVAAFAPDFSPGNLNTNRYLLASPGLVDTHAITRMQYKDVREDRKNNPYPKQFIRVTGFFHLTDADFDDADDRGYGKITMTVVLVPKSAFKASIPQPKALLSALGQWYRSKPLGRGAGQDNDNEFQVDIPRSAFTKNTEYWVMCYPSVVRKSEYTPNYVNDKVLRGVGINQIARGLSIWSNRPPVKPVITSPASGTTFVPGQSFLLSYKADDPDSVGTTAYSGNFLGFDLQYAPMPTTDNPTPRWKNMQWGFSYLDDNGNLKTFDTWYMKSSYQSPLQINSAMFQQRMMVDCATPYVELLDGMDRVALGSGDWQIRIRMWDTGTPYMSCWGRDESKTTNTPETAPEFNTSPWSDAIQVTVVATCLPPVAVSPTRDHAIPADTDVTLTWRYRNTHVPPLAQQFRSVRMRAVGSSEWLNVLVDDESDSFSWKVTGVDFEGTFHWEWQVNVTDTEGNVSGWSVSGNGEAQFWVVDPAQSGPIIERITDPALRATLGTGTYRAAIYRRGGQRKFADIEGLTKVSWTRVRDDKSEARISIRDWSLDEGKKLADLRTWAFELVLFRDNGYSVDRVWEGPITLLTYEIDEVTIEATDVIGYLYRRIIKNGYNDVKDGNTVVGRATQLIRDGFSRDDPNVLRYLVPITHTDDAREHRSAPDFSRTVYEEIDDMAANAGLDYTAVGRCIVVWDTSYPIGLLPEFRDEHLGASPIVSEYGARFATLYAITDGSGIYGVATRAPKDHETNDETGPVEMLATSWTSDSDEDTGTLTAQGAADLKKSFEEQAERGIAQRYPVPVVVRVPDNTSLNPDVLITIQQLVPGVAIPLRSTSTLRKVAQMQKLDSLNVTFENGKEFVRITMSPVNFADSETTEGRGLETVDPEYTEPLTYAERVSGNPDLYLFWGMDDVDGESYLVDSSGNLRDGYITGGGIVLESPPLDGGLTSLVCEDPGVLVTYTSAPDLSIVERFSVSLWAQRYGPAFDGTGYGAFLVGRDFPFTGDTSERSWSIFWNEDKTLTVRGWNEFDQVFIMSSGPLSDDKHHIGFTYGDGYAFLYVDGAVANGVEFDPITLNWQVFTMAATVDGELLFNGALDGFATFSEVLSAEEMQTLYILGTTP